MTQKLLNRSEVFTVDIEVRSKAMTQVMWISSVQSICLKKRRDTLSKAINRYVLPSISDK